MFDKEAWSVIERGHALFFAKVPRLKEAAELFREATRLAPRWAEPFGWLSAALERLGDLPGALTARKQALKLDSADPRHWVSLGAILIELRHWREAVRALEKGVSLHPHYAEADARLFLADAYWGAGQRKKAEEQWRIVSKMEPGYPSGDKPMKEARAKLGMQSNDGKPRTRPKPESKPRY